MVTNGIPKSIRAFLSYTRAARFRRTFTTMLKLQTLATRAVALALPALLMTSAFAQSKMSGGKMSGHKMMGGHKMGSKMSGSKMMGMKPAISTLVPVMGMRPSKKALVGAKIVSTTMVSGHPCYTVRLKSGKTVQMCTPANKKMMGGMMMSHSKMSGGHMMGGKMSGGSMMSGKK